MLRSSPMRPKIKKTHKTSTLLGQYESLAACSGATGIPLAVLKRAKRAGCPAFVAHRVDLVPLLTWLFASGNDAGVDWPAKFKEFQARREELKYEREKAELIEVAAVLEMDAAACSRWNAKRIHVEQEWPARLAGKDIPECRDLLMELTTQIGRILQGIRGEVPEVHPDPVSGTAAK